MPTVPQGPFEGAEYHHVTVTRDDDDYLTIEGKEVNVLRASIGGNDDIGGYYLAFRGEPEKIVKMLEMMTEAAKDMLPRGQYKDTRRRKGRSP